MLIRSNNVSDCRRMIPSRRAVFLLATTLFLLSYTSGETACWADALAGIDENILSMSSGSVYRVLDDPRAMTFWVPLSRVTICDQVGEMEGQIITYFEIRNEDAIQMVRALRER